MPSKIYCVETQYLTLAAARYVGIDSTGRVTSFDDTLQSYQSAGLKPLFVCSVVVPAYRLHQRLLFSSTDAVSISRFLSEVWSEKCALGMPSKLVLKKELAKASRGLVEWIQNQGVEISHPNHEELKSYVAFERHSRDILSDISYEWSQSVAQRDDSVRRYFLHSDLAVCARRLRDHDRFVRQTIHGRFKSMDVVHYEAWAERDRRYCNVESEREPDIATSIVELRQTVLPRVGMAMDDEAEPEPYGCEDIRLLISMWPGGTQAFMRDLDVNQRDFRLWLQRKSRIESSDMIRVTNRVRASFDPEEDSWNLSSGYLLIASSMLRAIELYTSLSHGGDLDYAFEVLGSDGATLEPRCIVFAACTKHPNILLINSKGASGKIDISRAKFINLSTPKQAPEEVLADLKVISKDFAQFEDPSRLGEAFYVRNKEWLDRQADEDAYGSYSAYGYRERGA